jgi:hypothetical protein
LIFRLPHGVVAGITTKRDLTPEGEDFVGVGLVRMWRFSMRPRRSPRAGIGRSSDPLSSWSTR